MARIDSQGTLQSLSQSILTRARLAESINPQIDGQPAVTGGDTLDPQTGPGGGLRSPQDVAELSPASRGASGGARVAATPLQRRVNDAIFQLRQHMARLSAEFHPNDEQAARLNSLMADFENSVGGAAEKWSVNGRTDWDSEFGAMFRSARLSLREGIQSVLGPTADNPQAVFPYVAPPTPDRPEPDAGGSINGPQDTVQTGAVTPAPPSDPPIIPLMDAPVPLVIPAGTAPTNSDTNAPSNDPLVVPLLNGVDPITAPAEPAPTNADANTPSTEPVVVPLMAPTDNPQTLYPKLTDVADRAASRSSKRLDQLADRLGLNDSARAKLASIADAFRTQADGLVEKYGANNLSPRDLRRAISELARGMRSDVREVTGQELPRVASRRRRHDHADDSNTNNTDRSRTAEAARLADSIAAGFADAAMTASGADRVRRAPFATRFGPFGIEG